MSTINKACRVNPKTQWEKLWKTMLLGNGNLAKRKKKKKKMIRFFFFLCDKLHLKTPLWFRNFQLNSSIKPKRIKYLSHVSCLSKPFFLKKPFHSRKIRILTDSFNSKSSPGFRMNHFAQFKNQWKRNVKFAWCRIARYGETCTKTRVNSQHLEWTT